MTPFLVCLATVLCLLPASVLSYSIAGECSRKCDVYHNIGYLCALQNQCTAPLDTDYKEQCYEQCMSLYYQCPSVCEAHYNQITAECQARCSGAGSSCEDDCFSSELHEIHPIPIKREVNIWQTVPALGRQRREAQDDSTKHVSPRDDSEWSSGSMSSEEVGDIFGIWRKKRDTKRSSGGTSSMDIDDIFEDWTNKRDTKRSPGSTSSMDMDQLFKVSTNKRDTKRSSGGTSSMDMDDIFEDWTNKRDSKRSPGSTSLEDLDDIFGIRRRGQDWIWEEGNSENDVYGDWKDKRQAETEIQQQKQ